MAKQRTGGSETGFGEPENGNGNVEPITIAIDNSDNGDGIPIVSATDATTDPEPPRRKRGRPTGSTNTSTKPKQDKKATDLSGILYSMHFMLAGMVNVKELKIDESEAKKMSDAIQRVNAEYGMIALTPKQEAWLNLAIVAGSVYGPRMVAHSLNKKADAREAREKKQAQTQPQPGQPGHVTIDSATLRPVM